MTIIATITSSLQQLCSPVADSLSDLTPQHYIRLIWIVGAYIFLRPYIELGFRKLFATQKEPTMASARTTSALNEDDSGGREETAETTSWGAAARKRQAIVIHAWEEEQRRIAEEDDWDGIDPDLLED